MAKFRPIWSHCQQALFGPLLSDEEKSFINLTVVDVTKHFSSSLTVRQNNLSCLALEIFFQPGLTLAGEVRSPPM
jgi:hypothetical protein